MPRRIAILESAAELFAARGYNAVSTREIAQSAEVNESTLFRMFGGKAGLAQAVWKNEFTPITKAMWKPISSDLERAAEMYGHWYVQHFHGRLIRLWAVLSVEAPELMPVVIIQAHISMMDVVRAAQQAGTVVDGAPKALVRALHSALCGYATLKTFNHPMIDEGASHDDVVLIAHIWAEGVKRGKSKHAHARI